MEMEESEMSVGGIMEVLEDSSPEIGGSMGVESGKEPTQIEREDYSGDMKNNIYQ